VRFLEGGRNRVTRELEAAMAEAASEKRFEQAAAIRDRLLALKQVRDLAVIKKDDVQDAGGRAIDVYGRIEGYDISNISGTDTVGSMVVFIDGLPRKSAYRKFAVEGVGGPDDTKSLSEVLRRRFGNHAPAMVKTTAEVWPLPDLILVDGGVGQVNAARRVLQEFGLNLPLVGLAKGPDRKQDELVYSKGDYELARLATAFKPLLQRVRDEAHRFAVGFHRQRRSRRLAGGRRGSG
jgi:excinuclease ABC subunit C